MKKKKQKNIVATYVCSNNFACLRYDFFFVLKKKTVVIDQNLHIVHNYFDKKE